MWRGRFGRGGGDCLGWKGPGLASLASVFSVGVTCSCSCSCSCSWSPPAGGGGVNRAHSEVGSKVHEELPPLGCLPAPTCVATPGFGTRRAFNSFSFPSRPFLAFGSSSAARIAPLADCGELGPRATEREGSKAFCVLVRTNVPTNAECTCTGNGIAREKLCGAAVRHCHCHMEKGKQSRGKKKKEKDLLQGALNMDAVTNT